FVSFPLVVLSGLPICRASTRQWCVHCTHSASITQAPFGGAFAAFFDYPLDLRRPEPQQTSHTDAAETDTGAPGGVVDCSRCDAERVSGLPWIEEVFHHLLSLYSADGGGRNEAINAEKGRESGICLRCRLCPQKSQMCLDVSTTRVIDESADVRFI